ncbi:MAG: hypothetical protein M1814_002339 [Vezdaea aestivalis]|nr:MAG: hypothetical protein M1814_002339 [Vezdaea aestivalis]
MPRPKKIGGPEPKRRSRNGCWPCKGRKVKCDETHPRCNNCVKLGETCDYSIKLNWEGRTKRRPEPVAVSPREDSTPNGNHKWTRGNSGFVTFDSRCPVSPTTEASSNSSNNGLVNVLGDRKEKGTVLYQGGESATEMSGLDGLLCGDMPMSSSDLLEMDPTRPEGSEKNDLQRRSKLDFINSGSRESSHFVTQVNQYPSPVDSNIDDSGLPLSRTFSSQGRPPLGRSTSPRDSLQHGIGNLYPFESSETTFGETQLKRARLPGRSDKAEIDFNMPPPRNLSSSSYSYWNGAGLDARHLYAFNTPVTPAGSSTASDEHTRSPPLPSMSGGPTPDRRFSVESLLSSPSELPYGRRYSTHVESTKTFGFDVGDRDLDIPVNDDQNAVTANVMPSTIHDANLDMVLYTPVNSLYPPFSTIATKDYDKTFEKSIYYARPVAIKIPTSLGPLPDLLMDNPMNLLYFHHFLNHTARILSPHDCLENPYKALLPQSRRLSFVFSPFKRLQEKPVDCILVALNDVNLLKLLLSYAASHRARLLGHADPANRIALWVKDVFPSLRQSLSGKGSVSSANLATAIMLTSLEVISPDAFGVSIPWQRHLSMARDMFMARGGAQTVTTRDKEAYFMARWLAYLDVMGALGGGKNDEPLYSGSYWLEANYDEDLNSPWEIDCLLGFTSRSISSLARISKLARRCSTERIAPNGELRPNWQPSSEIVFTAEHLTRELERARTHEYRQCSRRLYDDENESKQKRLEMVASNNAYHWAGLVHIRRRILGLPSSDCVVQKAVENIVSELCKVRKGGTAEACMLFPMFTAGCDAPEGEQRRIVAERLDGLSMVGMNHVKKARTLLSLVWRTGESWDTLVAGEFFG